MSLTKKEALENDPTLDDLTDRELAEALGIINQVAKMAVELTLRKWREGSISFDAKTSDHPTP